MSDIYVQHQNAFRAVSAFVVLKGGDRVATVALKFPKDGAGRLTAYLHLIGTEMVRGVANGYGYDKRSAAVSDACGKLRLRKIEGSPTERDTELADLVGAFQAAMIEARAQDWARALERAGFTVLQAV